MRQIRNMRLPSFVLFFTFYFYSAFAAPPSTHNFAASNHINPFDTVQAKPVHPVVTDLSQPGILAPLTELERTKLLTLPKLLPQSIPVTVTGIVPSKLNPDSVTINKRTFLPKHSNPVTSEIGGVK